MFRGGEIGTVWQPEMLHKNREVPCRAQIARQLDKLRCTNLKELKGTIEYLTQILREITRTEHVHSSNSDALLEYELIRSMVVSKKSWLLKWSGVAREQGIANHQWLLVNSMLFDKNIKESLYTFDQLLNLNKQQVSNLSSPLVQDILKNQLLPISNATDLNYLQKRIFMSETIRAHIKCGKLTAQSALKMSKRDFQRYTQDETIDNRVEYRHTNHNTY